MLVSLQIGMLTYVEWVQEAMGRQVAKKEVEEEEEEIVVVGGKEDDEGVGREAQQGGEVHPSGGTDSSLAAAAPPLEVQHTIRHAVRVSQGRALASNTTIIAPNPALFSPPPQISSLPPGFRPIWGQDSGREEGHCSSLQEGKGWGGAFVPLPSLLQACPPSNSPAPCPSPSSTGPANSHGNRCGPSCH